MALDELIRADVSALSFDTDPNLSKAADAILNNAWKQDNFVGAVNYDPAIDEQFRIVTDLWSKFVKLPTAVINKYDGTTFKQQRGTRVGWKRPGGTTAFDDSFRMQLMVGQELAEDHPLLALRKFGYYFPNVTIEESDFKTLISETVKLNDLKEDLDILTAESLARAQDLPSGYWAARLVYGDSPYRLIYYMPVEGKILKRHTMNTTVGTIKINDVNVVDIEESDGTLRHNLIKINPHFDIDWSALLLRKRGDDLVVQRRNGTKFHYDGSQNVIVINSGSTAADETAYQLAANFKVDSDYQGGVHWVEYGNLEDDGITGVRFGHFRPTAIVRPIPANRTSLMNQVSPLNYEAVLLARVLAKRGHSDPAALQKELDTAEKIATQICPERKLIDDLMKWEQKHKINRLRRYEHQIDDLYKMWMQ